METLPARVVARYVFEYQHIAQSYFTGEEFNDLGGALVREIEPRGLAYLMIEVCESATIYQTFVHNGVKNEFGDEYFSSGREPGAVGRFINGVWCPQLLQFSFLGLRGVPHPLQCMPFSKGPRHRHSLNKFSVVHRGRRARNRRRPIEPYTPWAILSRIDNNIPDFDRLVQKLLTAPQLPPMQDHRLADIPSRL